MKQYPFPNAPDDFFDMSDIIFDDNEDGVDDNNVANFKAAIQSIMMPDTNVALIDLNEPMFFPFINKIKDLYTYF